MLKHVQIPLHAQEGNEASPVILSATKDLYMTFCVTCSPGTVAARFRVPSPPGPEGPYVSPSEVCGSGLTLVGGWQ